MVKVKVFVGNLSFKTEEKDLAKEFEAAGKVASANIITRGTRSLGYGFVEMENDDDAKKAVEMLNKKMIDERQINVEIAKIREETPVDPNAAAGSPSAARGRGGRGRGRGGRGAANAGAPAAGGAAPAARAPRAPRNDAAAPAAGGAAGAGAPATGGRPPRQRGPRAPRTEGGAPKDGAAPQEGGQPAAPRRPRAPRAPRTEDKTPKTESATTLFVANLPFSVDDAGLSKIFEGLNLKTAHVVRKRNDRSKGFGFVEFNNADDQKKALSINDKDVEGRKLIVKIALTEALAAAAAVGAAPVTPSEVKK